MIKNNTFKNIAVLGSIAYDTIMDFPGVFADHLDPTKLHQLNVSFVVDRLERQLGGVATNICYNLSLVSKKKIQPIGAVGKDGQPLLNFFKQHKINVSLVAQDNRLYTAAGTVTTDRNDNQIWGYYYGASLRAKNVSLKHLSPRDTFCILGPTHRDAFLKVEQTLRRGKFQYLYDPGMALSWLTDGELRRGVLGATMLVGNDYEIAQIVRRTGLSESVLVKKGITVITTLGSKGVRAQSLGGSWIVPAYPLKKAKDPTGAGDAWRGGFTAAVAEGVNMLDSLIQGNALASFAVEQYGTVNHHPSRAQIAARASAIRRNIHKNSQTKK